MKQLRIAYVIQEFGVGGAEKIVLDYLRLFEARDDIAYIGIVLGKNNNSLYSKAAQTEGLNIVYLNCTPRRYKNAYLDLIRRRLTYNLKLYFTLKKFKPDVVHTHNTRMLKLITLCIKWCKKYRWFHTLHSDPYAVEEHNIENAKSVFNDLGVFPVCLNNAQFEKAKARYGISDCVIIRNITDVKRFSDCTAKREDVRKEIGIDNSAYVIGTVGRLAEVKNYDFLIEVFAKVLPQKPNSVLLFAGDGDKDSLYNHAKALGIEDRVIFLGSRTDVERIYRAMDVFTLTSTSEASSLVTVEAQIAGLPCVISSAIPAESVCTKKVVIMPKDASEQDWAAQLISPSNFAKLQTTVEDYSVENNLSKLLKAYKK